MPIIVGNRPIFRIRFQDANIREVRKGNELKGGLYKIDYINEGPKKVGVGGESGQNIPNYVGGYPAQSKQDFYFYVPNDMTAEDTGKILGNDFAYKSHADGGFNKPECDELYYIPAITKNFHRDLTLFCRGRQRKYLFEGTYKGNTEYEGGSDEYTFIVYKKRDGQGGYEDGYYSSPGEPLEIEGTVISEVPMDD